MFSKIKKLFKKSDHETVRGTIADLIEEIDDLIEDTEEKDVSIKSDERQLLGNVLDLRDLKAEDVMVPRAEIIAAPDTVSSDELLGLMVQHGYSAMPIYHDTLDTIIGFVHIKDILSFTYKKKELNIQHLMRKSILFISPAMQILDLLLEMKQNAHNIAIVADEHGGTDGMVCFSDLIEEIVGVIRDEYDDHEKDIEVVKEDEYIVEGSTRIDELNELIGVKIESEDFDTIGGFIVGEFGYIPEVDESIEYEGIRFVIEEVDRNRIEKLRIHT